MKYKTKVIFYSTKRHVFPNLNGKVYMPHFVIENTTDYLGIAFVSSNLNEFDLEGEAIVCALYESTGVDYQKLVPGVCFVIMEGKNKVGNGEVISILD